jgi:hypothetical protein
MRNSRIKLRQQCNMARLGMPYCRSRKHLGSPALRRKVGGVRREHELFSGLLVH